MTKLKVHWFKDCTAAPVVRVGDEWCHGLAPERLTETLNDVTCGACKGRILERVRALDWTTLLPSETQVLKRFAGRPEKK